MSNKKIVKPTEEQIENVKHMIVKNLTDEEIGEIISVTKVQKGEKALENFSEMVKFGAPVARPGRIAFDKVSEKFLEYVKEDIKDGEWFENMNEGMYDEIFFDKELELETLEEMKEEGEDDKVMAFKIVKKDVLKMEKEGLKIDRNLTWDIFHILNGERQKSYLERNGNDVQFLKELYSYIPDKKMKRIKNRWDKRFQNEE